MTYFLSNLQSILYILFSIFVLFLAGLVLNISTIVLTFVFIFIIFISLFLFVNLSKEKILKLTIISNILILGIVVYYTGIQFLNYIGILFVFNLLFWGVFRINNPLKYFFDSYYLIFIFIAFYSIVISLLIGNSIFHVLIAGVSMLAPLFLIFVFIEVLDGPNKDWLLKFFLILPFLQIPFAMHQRLVLGSGLTKWDSVTGTFGGQMLGTGPNSVLIIYMVVSLLFAIQKYITKQITFNYFVLIFMTIAVIAGLGETKALFVLLPIAILVQNLSLIRRSPLKFFSIFAFLCISLFLLQQWYEVFNYQARYGGDLLSFSERLSSTLLTQIDTDTGNYSDNGRLGRFGSIVFWYENTHNDLFSTIFGYGLGSSRDGFTGKGFVADNFSIVLNLTSFSAILWDFGVLGFLLISSIFFIKLYQIENLNRYEKQTSVILFNRTLQASIMVIYASIFYKNILLENLQFQFLVVIVFSLSQLLIMKKTNLEKAEG